MLKTPPCLCATMVGRLRDSVVRRGRGDGVRTESERRRVLFGCLREGSILMKPVVWSVTMSIKGIYQCTAVLDRCLLHYSLFSMLLKAGAGCESREKPRLIHNPKVTSPACCNVWMVNVHIEWQKWFERNSSAAAKNQHTLVHGRRTVQQET